MEEFTEDICKDRQTARDYLVKLGTHLLNGKLHPNYGGKVEDLMEYLIDKLKKLKEMLDKNNSDDWFYHKNYEGFPGWDFNKELIHPNTYRDDQYTTGAVGIRMDGDFWTAAVLPYEFKDLTIEQIVSILWPELADKEEVSYEPTVEETKEEYLLTKCFEKNYNE